LGAKTVIHAVENVSSDQQGVHLLVDAQVDYFLVGVKGGVFEPGRDFSLTLKNSFEGAVQMQVCGVHESDY
jgi:hypothetical protein